jgi:hypothetical protein
MAKKSPYEHERLAADEDEILRDGGRRTVSMMLKDGSMVELEDWQRDVIHAARLGLDDAAALHRPGARYCTDQAAADARERAYQESNRELQGAWRKPVGNSESGVGSHEFRGAQEGDQCTINGAPGHLRMVKGKLECMPDERQDAAPRTMTMDEAQKIKDEAWLESIKDLESAWRKPLP